MNRTFLEDIFEQISLLWEYEMAQRMVMDDAVQTPPGELEKIIARIEGERRAADERGL